MKDEVYWTTKRYVALQHLVGRTAKALAREFELPEGSVRAWAEEFKRAGTRGLTPTAVAGIEKFLAVPATKASSRQAELEKDLKRFLTLGSTAMRGTGQKPTTPIAPILEVITGSNVDDVAEKYSFDVDSLRSWSESFRVTARKALGDDRREKESAVLSLLEGEDVIALDEKIAKSGIRSLAWRGPCKSEEEERLAVEVLEWREAYLEAGSDSMTHPCGHLFILSGAPTAGKTMLINMLMRERSLRPAAVPKYTSRAWRGPDDDSEQHDDINDHDFEFTYPYNENRYGLHGSDIRDILSRGFNAFVVVSPPRIVRSIKKLFGPLAVSIYLHSDRAERKMEVNIRKRMSDSSSEELKKQVRAQTINLRLRHRQYVDNIALYDHVLLNTSSPEDLLRQAKKVIQLYEETLMPSTMSGFGVNVLFLLCAPPGSGKATISKILEDFGGKLIDNHAKVVDRAGRKSDGKEVEPRGRWVSGDQERGIIPDCEFDLTYLSNDSRFGIRCDEIWEKFSEGKAQLVITNMKVIQRFQRRFGPIVVPVYVYTPKEPEELRRYFIEKKDLSEKKAAERVELVNSVFLDFIENIALFRHVILNTDTRDDIADQMLNLLEHYEVRRNILHL